MINEWLENFKTNWAAKDIDEVLELFTDDVEYWETPSLLINGKDELRNEWSAITNQNDINLDLKVFSSTGNKHTVLWTLSYVNEESETKRWAGTYLIELNDSGKCSYFHQTGEICTKI